MRSFPTISGCSAHYKDFDSVPGTEQESASIRRRVWDLDSGELLRTLPGYRDTVRAVAISADGRHAVTGDAQTVKVWT